MSDIIATVTMRKAKETLNKVRFEAEDDGQPVDSVYVGKRTLARFGDPDKITVTVTPAA